ncbi:homoserine dehydrogenase [candidate division KSB1 bacterium]
MDVNVVLCGFGNVGRALGRLIEDRRSHVYEKYDINFICNAVIASKGSVVSDKHLPLSEIADFVDNGGRLDTFPEFGRMGYDFRKAVNDLPVGAMFESTLTDIMTGGIGLEHFEIAIENNCNVISANKGPLVLKMPELMKAASEKGLKLKYSGATAAALPTTDVGLICFAGSTIQKIEGIFTATTNLLLTRMAETGQSYEEALKEAQELGVAETDPSLDVEGWDTANKTVILANSFFECELRLSDVKVEGITGLDPSFVKDAKDNGSEVKLLGVAEVIDDEIKAYVKPVSVEPDHPLFGINGTSKGIAFTSDTLGAITVTGGKAGPDGTAASMLKDFINIYRKDK